MLTTAIAAAGRGTASRINLMSQLDEFSLLQRIAARDGRAFETLYHLYYPRLFGFLFRLTRSAETVEEVLNDVMLAVWRGADRFAGRARPSTWIFGIAHRKALKALSRRPAEVATATPPPEPVAEDEGSEARVERRELRAVLASALGHLSPEQRAVVELTYYQGFSYPEIAEVLDCPVNTVKTRMFHARRRLRELLPTLGVRSHVG
jgi:RNA polymerase sigma-70 factor (ECF subfamily)